MRQLTVFNICMMAVFLCAGQAESQHTLIRFKHLAGNSTLKLFDETYTNSLGEPFVVTKFRYYISHLSITDTAGRQTNFPNDYWLVNEQDSLSKEIRLPHVYAIRQISFVVGVDSIKNVSGVQTGALDPANGMFWTWNSGYVFAKLEGQSDASHAPAHEFSWDVGGFRQDENALRTVKLTLDKNIAHDHTITIAADILKWFDGNTSLSIAKTPACHQPGKLAEQIADNYSTMFSVSP